MRDAVSARIDAGGLRSGRARAGLRPARGVHAAAGGARVDRRARPGAGRAGAHPRGRGAEEDLAQRAEYGSVPALLDAVGLLDGRVLAAHGVQLSDSDVALLASRGAAVAHCPGSNAKLAAGVARVTALRRAGVRVGLGTDGPASGDDLDLWAQARLAGLLARVASGGRRGADRGRAAADGHARRRGRDRPTRPRRPRAGRWADLVHVDLDDPAFAAPTTTRSSCPTWSGRAAPARRVTCGWPARRSWPGASRRGSTAPPPRPGSAPSPPACAPDPARPSSGGGSVGDELEAAVVAAAGGPAAAGCRAAAGLGDAAPPRPAAARPSGRGTGIGAVSGSRRKSPPGPPTAPAGPAPAAARRAARRGSGRGRSGCGGRPRPARACPTGRPVAFERVVSGPRIGHPSPPGSRCGRLLPPITGSPRRGNGSGHAYSPSGNPPIGCQPRLYTRLSMRAAPAAAVVAKIHPAASSPLPIHCDAPPIASSRPARGSRSGAACRRRTTGVEDRVLAVVDRRRRVAREPDAAEHREQHQPAHRQPGPIAEPDRPALQRAPAPPDQVGLGVAALWRAISTRSACSSSPTRRYAAASCSYGPGA